MKGLKMCVLKNACSKDIPFISCHKSSALIELQNVNILCVHPLTNAIKYDLTKDRILCFDNRGCLIIWSLDGDDSVKYRYE